MPTLLFIPTSIGLEYSHNFNTFSMKLSTPQGISADIKWNSDPADKDDFDAGGSATLTGGQDMNLHAEFFVEKFVQDQSRSSTTQNLIDLWQSTGADRSITPTVSKLKNGDYAVSGLHNGDIVMTMRTFDFNHDGQLDCYFIFEGYRTEGVYQDLLNYIASSANVTPYSVANWIPYSD